MANPGPIRRSFTTPASFAGLSRPRSSPQEKQSGSRETLFVCGQGKVVEFSPTNASLLSPRSRRSSGVTEVAPVGSLPWASRTEKLPTVGRIEIYVSATGTTHLECAKKLITTLFPKSQCWCVDGDTIFVVAKGRDSYYRIELPNLSEQDRLKAAELKQVFTKVLQYELTPCPFRRPFEVELPETPKKILKPWKPKNKTPTSPENPMVTRDGAADSSSEQENTDSAGEEHSTSSQISVSGDAPAIEEKKEGVDGKAVRREEQTSQASVPDIVSKINQLDGTVFEKQEQGSQASVLTEVPVISQLDRSFFEEEEQGRPTSMLREFPAINQVDRGVTEEDDLEQLKTPTRPSRGTGSGMRSVTAPAPLNFSVISTADPADERSLRIPKRDSDAASIASSVDSFHSFVSFHSPISPLPPSPSYSDPLSPSESNIFSLEIDVPRSRQHKRDLSELTVTGSTFPSLKRPDAPEWPDLSNHTSPPLETPELMDDAASQTSEVLSEAITPSPNSTLRNRLHRRRRTLSPMPSPSNLYDPKVHMSDFDLTTALIQKTYSYILVHPIQLVALMLGIASKFANNAFHTRTLSEPRTGEKLVSGTWSYDATNEHAVDDFDDSWDEDDFGVPLSQAPSAGSRDNLNGEIGGSWEVD
ncbi:MAG: hypothetical protein MMC33_001693 [Icmadophila ericetorum]|nr:hypothetical protein [Icmadophila ericetorum]